MTIKKYQGKTEEEATIKAKKELGEHAVIMSVREIKPKGMFSVFKGSSFEVTAAIEEKETFTDPVSALKNVQKIHDTINMTADEPIHIPVQQKSTEMSALEILQQKKENAGTLEGILPEKKKGSDIEERLENLQSMIERQLSADKDGEVQDFEKTEGRKNKNLAFVKVLYEVLLENEVHEIYVNQLIDEMEKVSWNGSSVDLILSNIYQKMILKFGQPKVIDISGKKPKVVFFVGPTGVGKTTTIAKVASKFKVEQDKKVAFLTADTYRIAAAEQLRTYANILDTPLSIVYSPEELNTAIERVINYDLVLIDTAGFSHKSEKQRDDIKELIYSVDKVYESEVYLVLSATTKYKDLIEITESYKDITDYKIIFTKLDETTTYGNILNIRMHSGADLSYITNGQNVPDDIEVFDTQKIVKRLLGGR